MTSTLLWILLLTTMGGIASAVAAGGFLLLSERTRLLLLPGLVSFAVGALLGAAFLALLPDALETGIGTHELLASVLAGLLVFFVLEKLVLWRHSHGSDDRHDDNVPQAAGYIILIGDAIHNFVDGLLIASAFLTDVRLGIVTGLAIVAHEIPQEVGDFAILLHSGFTRGRAFFYNLLASLAMMVGGLIAYFALSAVSQALPYVLGLAAASFIYVSVADLIPSLHRRVSTRALMTQTLLILAGVAFISFAESHLH